MLRALAHLLHGGTGPGFSLNLATQLMEESKCVATGGNLAALYSIWIVKTRNVHALHEKIRCIHRRSECTVVGMREERFEEALITVLQNNLKGTLQLLRGSFGCFLLISENMPCFSRQTPAH